MATANGIEPEAEMRDENSKLLSHKKPDANSDNGRLNDSSNANDDDEVEVHSEAESEENSPATAMDQTEKREDSSHENDKDTPSVQSGALASKGPASDSSIDVTNAAKKRKKNESVDLTCDVSAVDQPSPKDDADLSKENHQSEKTEDIKPIVIEPEDETIGTVTSNGNVMIFRKMNESGRNVTSVSRGTANVVTYMSNVVNVSQNRAFQTNSGRPINIQPRQQTSLLQRPVATSTNNFVIMPARRSAAANVATTSATNKSVAVSNSSSQKSLRSKKKSQPKSGNYPSASTVVRDLIQRQNENPSYPMTKVPPKRVKMGPYLSELGPKYPRRLLVDAKSARSFGVEKPLRCVACGDEFHHQSSLLFHRKRRSVLITHKCDTCQNTLHFFNKCALIEHFILHYGDNWKTLNTICCQTDIIPVAMLSESTQEGLFKWSEDLKRGEKALKVTNNNVTPAKAGSKPTLDAVIVPQPKFMPNPQLQQRAITVTSAAATATNQKTQKGTPVKQMILPKSALPALAPKILVPVTATAGGTTSCSECGVTFEDNRKRWTHFQAAGVHGCANCNVFCPSACSLRAHERVHRGEKPQTCPECGQRFDNQDVETFLRHIKDQCFHLSRRMEFRCMKCTQLSYFTTFDKLCHHVLDKHSDVYFKCPVCPLAFRTKDTFQKHSHDDNKTHPTGASLEPNTIAKCPLCDKVFNDVGHLKVHLSDHQKEVLVNSRFRFYCLATRCTEAFWSKGELQSHFKRHSPYERTLWCAVCFTIYPTQTMLENHLATHPGSRQAQALKSRTNTVVVVSGGDGAKKSGDDIHTCPTCHISFEDGVMYQRHLAQKHPQKSAPSGSPLAKRARKAPEDKAPEKSEAKEAEAFGCDACDSQFESEHLLGRHKLRTHEDASRKTAYKCWMCSHQSFEKGVTLEKHLMMKHRQPRVEIDYNKILAMRDGSDQNKKVKDSDQQNVSSCDGQNGEKDSLKEQIETTSERDKNGGMSEKEEKEPNDASDVRDKQKATETPDGDMEQIAKDGDEDEEMEIVEENEDDDIENNDDSDKNADNNDE